MPKASVDENNEVNIGDENIDIDPPDQSMGPVPDSAFA